MAYLYRMRSVNPIQHVDGDRLLGLRLRGVLDVGAQLDEKQARLPRGRPPGGNFSEAPNLLQHFHYFDFFSHTPVEGTQPQVMCQSY